MVPAPQRCPSPPGTPFSPGLGQLPSLVPLVGRGLTAPSSGRAGAMRAGCFMLDCAQPAVVSVLLQASGLGQGGRERKL